jgi:hypothetical protein
MKTALLLLACLLLACGKARIGQVCTNTAECPTGSSCNVSQNRNDAGSCVSGQSFCDKPCSTNDDCRGVTGVFGPMESCASDCAGQRFCI